MDKLHLQYQLITKDYDWNYYTNDEGTLKLFRELLIEGFPIAIEKFFRAPNRFVKDTYKEFQNKHFPNVIGLYQAIKYQDGQVVSKKKTEDEQTEIYQKTVTAAIQSGKETEVVGFLDTEIWSKSTVNILMICKRFHNKIVNDKQAGKDKKDFHKKCTTVIDSRINKLDKLKTDAVDYFYRQEHSLIVDTLLSDSIDDKSRTKIRNLVGVHGKELFTREFFEELQTNYKLIDWVEVYIETILYDCSEERKDILLATFVNSSLVEKVSDSCIGKILNKYNGQQQMDLFASIDKIGNYKVFLKCFTLRFNKPDESLSYLKLYLEKFPESGEAIYNVVEFAENGRAMINSIPDLVEKHAKRWLLNYNFHNNEDEIASVIEALDSVKRIEKMFFDFSFWRDMEKCNAFIRVIENMAFSIGFDKCFDMIEKNFYASKAYGIQSLASKWIQAANSLAINNDEAQEAYVFFFSALTDENSSLDQRGKEILIRETLDYMLKQASDNKKLADLEHKKLLGVKDEVLEEIIHRICKPIETLEKMVMAYSDPSMPNASDMLFIRNLIGKVRIGLELAGILPVEENDNWVKQNVIPYNPSKHECLEDIEPGELVTCLSLGMMNAEKSYYEKAAVKKYVGESKDGDNL